MSEADPALRVSDAEREATAGRLRQAGEEGRIDLGELEERLAAAYAARTEGELAALVADLPATPATAGGAAVAPRGDRSRDIRQKTAAFLTPNVICILVWLATGTDGGFWPIWVLLGTGIAYASFLIKTFVAGD